MIGLILLLGALALLARQFGSLDWIVENETHLRQFVHRQPWLAWLIGLLVYTTFSLVPGTVGKSVVCGWLFGFWSALLIADIGLTVAAVVSFLAARFFVRDMVVARLGGLVRKLDRALEHDGTFYLLMMRLAHVPFNVVNYGAGTTSVPLGKFAWTTAAGIAPGSMIFVFVGTRIPTLGQLSDQGVWQLLDPLLFGVLATTVVFPLLIRWTMRRFKKHTGVHPDLELTEIEAFHDGTSQPESADGD
jgi:uncharacterized membrane protein YdjX (TVP38/TMEM64 family)